MHLVNRFSERINHAMCGCEETDNSSRLPEALSCTGWKEEIYRPELVNIVMLNCVGLITSTSSFKVMSEITVI